MTARAFVPNAQTAREAVPLTIEQAAKRARVSPGYLRRLERGGARFPYALAVRLACVYGGGVPLSAFLRVKNPLDGLEPSTARQSPIVSPRNRRG